jgi:hypothetical protein
MAEKPEVWNPTCERFVAYLDIMGFKDRLQREGHRGIKKMFDCLYPTIEELEVKVKERLARQSTPQIPSDENMLFPITFSDSIIIVSTNRSLPSAIYILSYVEHIFSVAISRGIPMKGAIAFGEMTVYKDNRLYFGQPLIDAYELQRELQFYGVALHHTCENYLNDPKFSTIKNSFGKYLVQYRIPMKSGSIIHHIVDWTIDCDTPKNKMENFYNIVSGSPRIYVDNTLEFIKWLSEEKGKKEKI